MVSGFTLWAVLSSLFFFHAVEHSKDPRAAEYRKHVEKSDFQKCRESKLPCDSESGG